MIIFIQSLNLTNFIFLEVFLLGLGVSIFYPPQLFKDLYSLIWDIIKGPIVFAYASVIVGVLFVFLEHNLAP